MNYDIMNNIYTTTNTAITTSGWYYSDPLYAKPQTFRFEPVYQMPDSAYRLTPVAEAAPIPENDMAWLKRRVDEISWVPA